MAQTPPPVIDAAPAAPDRSNRITFAVLAQAFTIWMKNAATQFAAAAQNVYNNAVDAYNNAQSAAASAAGAAAYAGAVAFNAATNYAQYGLAISTVTLLVYRRKTAGISATDPSADSANWVPASLIPVVTVRTAVDFTALPNVLYIITANGVNMTLPAATTPADLVYYRLGVGVSRMTLKGNGRKIEGQAIGVDITVSVLGYRGKLAYDATDGYLHFH